MSRREPSQKIINLREAILEFLELQREVKDFSITGNALYAENPKVRKHAIDGEEVSRELSHMYHRRREHLIDRVEHHDDVDRSRYAYMVLGAIKPLPKIDIANSSASDMIVATIGNDRLTASKIATRYPSLGNSTKVSNMLSYAWRIGKLDRVENAGGEGRDQYVYFRKPSPKMKVTAAKALKTAKPGKPTMKVRSVASTLPAKPSHPKSKNPVGLDISTHEGTVTIALPGITINIKTE